jgi:membrane-associated protease RseP (regulator of RpoE activity)
LNHEEEGGAREVPAPPAGSGRALPPARGRIQPYVVPAILFLLTVATTTLANGPFYAACLLGILVVHEGGHYFMCRRYRVPATLPYFIPLPPMISFLGTLGAVIRMRLMTGERRILYDIGIAGPLAGLCVAIPVSCWGLAHSRIVPKPPPGTSIELGDSVIFHLLQQLFLGPVGPGKDVLLHPVALAGWTGLFVTGLNLIPVGMLDGGHVAYGLLGRKAIWVNIAAMIGIAALGILVFPFWLGWFVLLLLIGVRHPAASLPGGQLDRRRLLLGLVTIILFGLCFVPRPIRIP